MLPRSSVVLEREPQARVLCGVAKADRGNCAWPSRRPRRKPSRPELLEQAPSLFVIRSGGLQIGKSGISTAEINQNASPLVAGFWGRSVQTYSLVEPVEGFLGATELAEEYTGMDVAVRKTRVGSDRFGIQREGFFVSALFDADETEEVMDTGGAFPQLQSPPGTLLSGV